MALTNPREELERTCRYGHGPLLNVDQYENGSVTYGLLVYAVPVTGQPFFQHGLRWWVCKKCGYSELQDSDVNQTLRNLGAQN